MGNGNQNRSFNKKIYSEDKAVRGGDDEWDQNKQIRKKHRNKANGSRASGSSRS